MAEIERDHNPYELDKKEEAPSNYISSAELLSKFNKYNIKIEDEVAEELQTIGSIVDVITELTDN